MSDSTTTLVLVAAMLIKHFLADFPLQTTWMALNKGKPWQPEDPNAPKNWAGYAHAGIHGALSLLVLTLALPWLGIPFWAVILMAVIEVRLHQRIDYATMNINEMFQWSTVIYNEDGTPKGRLITSPTYYLAMGGDQLLHGLTYVVMLLFALN